MEVEVEEEVGSNVLGAFAALAAATSRSCRTSELEKASHQ